MNDEHSTQSQQTGHEPAAVGLRGLLIGTAGLIALVALSLWAMWKLTAALQDTREEPGVPAVSEKTAQTPPRTPLEPDQRAQRLRYEAQQHELLTRYQWLDEKQDTARIPIDRAMQLIEKRYTSSTEEETP